MSKVTENGSSTYGKEKIIREFACRSGKRTVEVQHFGEMFNFHVTDESPELKGVDATDNDKSAILDFGISRNLISRRVVTTILEENFPYSKIIGISPLKSRNVWCVTFEKKTDKEAFLEYDVIEADGEKGYVYNIGEKRIHGTIHWLPLQFPEPWVRNVLQCFGTGVTVEREKAREFGCQHLLSGVRTFSMRLAENITTLEQLPYKCTINGFECLFKVANREIKCFSCSGLGHEARNCPEKRRNDNNNRKTFAEAVAAEPEVEIVEVVVNAGKKETQQPIRNMECEMTPSVPETPQQEKKGISRKREDESPIDKRCETPKKKSKDDTAKKLAEKKKSQDDAEKKLLENKKSKDDAAKKLLENKKSKDDAAKKLPEKKICAPTDPSLPEAKPKGQKITRSPEHQKAVMEGKTIEQNFVDYDGTVYSQEAAPMDMTTDEYANWCEKYHQSGAYKD